MLNGVLSVCLSLAVLAAASSLSCRWMDHKFTHFSGKSLDLIDAMAKNSTNTTGDADVDFPNDLFKQASRASDDHKLCFTVQVLEEVFALFEEDHSAASWEETTEEHFLMVVSQQVDGLHSCIGTQGHKRNKKLHMYFKRLSTVLERMGHSAEAWELIRKEMKSHLMRADQLVSSLLTN